MGKVMWMIIFAVTSILILFVGVNLTGFLTIGDGLDDNLPEQFPGGPGPGGGTPSGPTCGDNLCESGETEASCPSDCQFEEPVDLCGDGECDATLGEDTESCAVDCVEPIESCGDGICNATLGEGTESCSADCFVEETPVDSLPGEIVTNDDVGDVPSSTETPKSNEINGDGSESDLNSYSGATHTACTVGDSPQCVVLLGAGNNECSTNNDCEGVRLSSGGSLGTEGRTNFLLELIKLMFGGLDVS